MKDKKSFGNVMSTKIYSYDEFLTLEQSPVQRNHKTRAKEKRVFEKLNALLPQHTVIATAQLSQDAFDPETGKQWYKNQSFLIDAHTRRQFWQNGSSDYLPESLTSQHFMVDDIGEVRDLYYSFDNSTNTEKSSDLAYGACRYLNMELNNISLYQVTGVTWAAHFYDRKQFPKGGGYDGNGLIVIYGEFKNEIKFLDSFSWSNKIPKYPHPLRTASLLFLKKWDSDIARTIVQRVFANRYESPDSKERTDGVTSIIEHIKANGVGHANYETIPVQTEYYLYWLNQAYQETQGKERLHQKGSSSGIMEGYVKSVKINEFAQLDDEFSVEV